MITDWTIIYHTADSQICPHIHRSFYEKSNPSANILYADGREYFLPDPCSSHQVKDVNSGSKLDISETALKSTKKNKLKRFMILNHDKYLRDWLKDNFRKITTNNVAFFEWDVLLNKELPPINIDSLHVKFITNRGKRPWYWMKHVDRIDKNISTGVAPFGTFYANKYFVEQMIDAKYDYLYDQSLFCEARLRVLAELTQTKIVEEKKIHLRALEGEEVPAGCFHPVKSKINPTP
jgi:hypothetical protein